MRRLLLFLLLFTPAYGQVTNPLTLSKLQYSGNTFTLAGRWDFTGRLLLPHSSTPPATDCDEAGEKSRIYIDDDLIAAGSSIFICNGTGGWVQSAGGGGGGTPGGSPSQVQFNNAGAFGGVSNITASGSTITVGAGGSLVPSSTGTVTSTNVSTGLLANCTGSNIAGEFRVRATGTGAMANFCTGQGSPVLQYLANGRSTGNAVISNDAIHATLADIATASYTATYLAFDGTNCSGGDFALGVDTMGNAQCGTPGGGVYLPLAGGTMTGDITLDPNTDGIIVPVPSPSNALNAGLKFLSRGDYVNAPWRITNQSPATGYGSEDHVLSFDYNTTCSGTTCQKDNANDVAVQMHYESRFASSVGDPSLIRGIFEWNLNIDPNIGSTTISTVRPFALNYDMDTRAMGFSVGQPADPNSTWFDMGYNGNGNFIFAGLNAGAVFADLARARVLDPTHADPTQIDSQSRIRIDPGGDFNASDRALIITNFGAWDMDLETGLGTDGTTRGDMYFGYYRPSRATFGSTISNSARLTVDGTSDQVQAAIVGHSTQTANIFLIEKDDGTDLFSVANSGDVKVLGNTVLPIPTGLPIANSSGILNFNYSLSLAGNPAFNAEECAFTTAGTGGGGFICEGSTGGNGNEQLHLFPALDGADTTDFIQVGRAGSAALDFNFGGAADQGTCQAAQTITVTGAVVNDIVTGPGVPNASYIAGINWTVWVSAADTVSVQPCCATALDCADTASGTWNVHVITP